MKYLILGASGFIGSHLTNKLMENKKNELTLFDRKINKYNNLDKINVIEGNFSATYDFNELVRGQDVVFHLISTSLPNSEKKISIEIEENVISTLALLDACVEENVKKIIFISSGGTIYGESEGKPFKETDTTNPICSYGIQKLMIEKYLYLYNHKYGLDYSIIRLANPYGPGQNASGTVGAITVFLDRVIKNDTITIYGDGGSIRDYIYIEDAIKGIINIANYNSEQKIFNLGSGLAVSLKEIIDKIESITKTEIKINFLPKRINDLEYSVLDISNYSKNFPEHIFISLENGIREMYYYLKKL